jgi:tRNA uridine 5-carboxymethylaminomethyl modification enzyme
METGYRLGLVQQIAYDSFRRKRERINAEVKHLHETKLGCTRLPGTCASMNLDGVPLDLSCAQFLRRQDVSYDMLLGLMPEIDPLDDETKEAIEIIIKYDGYIKRQQQQVEKFKRLEERSIPPSFSYDRVIGLSSEVLEKLKRVKPASVGQASRISGVTPASISLLLVALERHRQQPSYGATDQSTSDP